jgi:hypothetical protein
MEPFFGADHVVDVFRRGVDIDLHPVELFISFFSAEPAHQFISTMSSGFHVLSKNACVGL